MSENSASAVQEVDLVPPAPPLPVIPPPSAPIPPPAPPSTPSFSAVAKKFMSGGQPVTQETTTRQVVYPGLPEGGSALATPGVAKRSMSCVSYLAQISQDPACAGYQVCISRKLPAVFNGVRFPFGELERFPASPYMDIYEQIKQIHGGGKYFLKVMDDEGRQVHGMEFSIDTLSCPPILRTPGNGYGVSGQAPGQLSAGSFTAIGGEQEDIQKLRAEESRARAEEAVIVAKNRVEQTQRNIERQRKRETEEEERKMMGPQNEEARRKMDDLRHETDSRFQMMNSSFEKLMVILATQKPADNGMTAMMPMMIEMMKSSTAQMTALMTALVSGGGNKAAEMTQFFNMQMQAQEKMTTALLSSATASASKSERLLEHVFMNKLEKPEESLKQMLEMQDRGEKKAMELFRMLEDARGDRDEGEVLNPDSGFFGNVGNLILHGLKNMVSGAARGGGTKALELLSGILQKPAGTTQFSEQELQMAAQRIAQSQQQARPSALLNAPQPQALITPPPPPAGQAVRPKIKLFDRIYETIDAQPVAVVQAPVSSAALPVVQEQPVAVVEVQTQQSGVMVETVEQPVPPQPQQEQPQQAESGDDYVNEAVNMAIQDINAGRKEHDWVDFALGKWSRDFLQALAQAPDDEARFTLLQQATDPELFKALAALLLDAQKPQNYRDFVENMKALIEEVTGGQMNAAA